MGDGSHTSGSRLPMDGARNFALVGAAGFVAPRHMRAIRDSGHRLVAATDPNDTVGVLDQFGFGVRYFREIERFDRHLDAERRAGEDRRVHWVSVCSPNHLHAAHVGLALRNGANALCEKPLVVAPEDLDTLERLEEESGRRVATVLQLRLHPEVLALRRRLSALPVPRRHQVTLTYVTARGGWYRESWKGDETRSGGVAANIGIHFFDLLLWLFGAVDGCAVSLREPGRMAGSLRLASADVTWFLSIHPEDLPFAAEAGGRTSHRLLAFDGEQIELSDHFAELHTMLYLETLAGRGFGIADARGAIELAYRIRTAPLVTGPPLAPRAMAAGSGSGQEERK
jgi:UDP-N-acetyl-2-amino-2-deoxyglucuronate dehydrogenase